jgi:hypothetical protein
MTSLKANQSRKLSFLARQPYVTHQADVIGLCSPFIHWSLLLEEVIDGELSTVFRWPVSTAVTEDKYVNKIIHVANPHRHLRSVLQSKHYPEYLQKKKLSVYGYSQKNLSVPGYIYPNWEKLRKVFRSACPFFKINFTYIHKNKIKN